MLISTLIAALLCALAAWAGTRLVLAWLVARDVMDRPNERSSHARPVPRGGGIAVITVAVAAWLVLAGLSGSLLPVGAIALLGALLGLLSFVDDVYSLGAGLRLGAHALAVALAVVLLLPADALLFGGLLPGWLDHLIVALSWIWFVNLYNFMDGIDGITGVETVAIAGGLCLLHLVLDMGIGAPLPAVLAGAMAGFLLLNWHPARIFLGDVGSVPLGYMLGFLLVWQACVEGRWWLALILPLYYWGDATTTLVARALRGEKIWQAHRSHAYQAAVQAGRSHARVALEIAALNAWLLALTLAVAAAVIGPWTGSAIALVSTALTLCYLRGWPAGGRR